MARKKQQKVTQQDILLAALEALYLSNGGHVGPQALLDAARDPSSPFHDHFQWDDDEAAEQFRLIQAGQMIRRWKGSIIKIDRETQTVKIETVRRVQSPQNSRGKGRESYQTVSDIMADPDLRESMLKTVLKELMAYRRRYAQLHELADVWFAVDIAVDKLEPSSRPGAESRPEA